MPMFWSGYGTTIIYKNLESTNCPVKAHKYQDYNLSRRHVAYASDGRGSSANQGYCNVSSTLLRVCNKYKKVHVRTLSGNRVFGSANQLKNNDTFFEKGKVKCDSKGLLEFVCKPSHNSFKSNKNDRKVMLHNSSSIASKVAIPLFAGATDSSSPKISELSTADPFESQIPGGTFTVGGKPRSLQWEENSFTITRNVDSNRCFHGGMGSILQGNIHRRPLEFQGEITSYKRLRTNGSETCFVDFHKDVSLCEVNSYANRQHSSINLSV